MEKKLGLLEIQAGNTMDIDELCEIVSYLSLYCNPKNVDIRQVVAEHNNAYIKMEITDEEGAEVVKILSTNAFNSKIGFSYTFSDKRTE